MPNILDSETKSFCFTKDSDKVSASPSSGVSVGNLVTISTTSNRLGAETEFDVVGGAETQSLNIHTSCSNPLILGESFGSMTLVDFIPEN